MTDSHDGNGRLKLLLRVGYDVAVLGGLTAMAFYAGKIDERVARIMSQRGAVQISMEADSRLTKLEQQVVENDRRLDSLEKR